MLRQATDIQRYMSTLPPNFDGASEWTRLAASLGELAANYGTTLPLPEGAQARRMNDGELKKAAEDVAKSADQFKKDLDSSLKTDKTIDVATREACGQGGRRREAGCEEARIRRRRWQARVGRGEGTTRFRLADTDVNVGACTVTGRANSVGIGRTRPGQSGAGVPPSGPGSLFMIRSHRPRRFLRSARSADPVATGSTALAQSTRSGTACR